MKINFDMDINVSDWAEAIGYTVVGDKVVSKNVFALSNFEECISDYISESIECGVNSCVIVERFFANSDEQHGLRDMLEECERVETIPSVVEEITDMDSLKREEKLALIVDGADAVFLPGKIHGCEDQLYIIYHNNEANSGKGSFEIEILDYERVLKLADSKDMCAEVLFEKLSDIGISVHIVVLPDCKDPDEYINKYGSEDFLKLIENAPEYVSYGIKKLRTVYNIERIGDKLEYISKAISLIGYIKDVNCQKSIVEELSTDTDISTESIWKELHKTGF